MVAADFNKARYSLNLRISHPPLVSLIRIVSSLAEESYLVGGAVRDALSGKFSYADLDIAVNADGFKIAEQASRVYGKGCAFVPLDVKRGTARIVLLETNRITVDISSFKGSCIDEDLRRRDFSINAAAVSLHSLLEKRDPIVIDPCRGRADLRNGIIRACSNQSFQDDPLRILRAFRFAARLGFRIDPDTLNLMTPLLHRLQSISGERIRDELMAVLSLPNAWKSLCDMDHVGILDHLFPELRPMKQCTQNDYHHLDVWGHSLESIRMMESLLSGETPCFGSFQEMIREYVQEELVPGRPRTALLKLAALFHDSGKPATRFVDPEGRVRFFGHELVSVDIFLAAADRLKPATVEIETIIRWISGHMAPVPLFESAVSKRALYRLQRKHEKELPGLLLLCLSDLGAARGPARRTGLNESICAHVRDALGVSVEIADTAARPFLNGKDVMELIGISPGPEVGRILARLAELQAVGQIRNEEEARSIIRKSYMNEAE